MTPEPTDLLRGARQTLADVVLPSLTDPFAIEQLKTVLRVLTHLEAVIDDAYPLEAAEADDLRRFLGAATRSGEPNLAALHDTIVTASMEGPAGSDRPSFRELRDGNVIRKRLVTEIIRALPRVPPDRAAASALRTALDDLARRQLERERRWTNPRRGSK